MIGRAIEQVFSAKTLTLWLILSLVAFIGFLVLIAVAVIFHKTFEGYYQALLAFLGLSGGGGTARGVISDGIMPRLAMIEGAKTDPSVALESPSPMTLKPPPAPTNYAAPPVAPTGGSS